ncbi:hypothetical protein FRX31_010612 [Thalictrum thalictroides]|uniref:Uncharacterized protein n=1 Tax=Thalictrum thalictroides TaxID=46969 RepID=A0A7J6WQZ6_THATH|nr:hypothetical protein FRX31_010612 [Thalictrum thalictroides]
MPCIQPANHLNFYCVMLTNSLNLKSVDITNNFRSEYMGVHSCSSGDHEPESLGSKWQKAPDDAFRVKISNHKKTND